MGKRKTIDVAELISMTNEVLRDSMGPRDIEWRRGLIYILESALFKTGNYKGFKYLTEGHVPDGERPGINSIDLDIVGRFENTDRTRVAFFG